MITALQLATTAILLHMINLIITMKSTALHSSHCVWQSSFFRNPLLRCRRRDHYLKASMSGRSQGTRNRKFLEKAGSDQAQKTITQFIIIITLTDIEKLL